MTDKKSDGVALISVSHPETAHSSLPTDIDPASVVTVELSEEQVKNIGVYGGLRISPKRGRGRPKIAGPRPWEVEGVSRKTWYKRRAKA